MFEKFARALTLFSVNQPGLVCTLFVLIFALGTFGSSRLEMRLNYMELLPDDAPQVVDLKWMMKKAGTEGYLVAGLSGGTQEERREWIGSLAETIEALPEIHYVEYRQDPEFFRKNLGSLLPLTELKEIRARLEEKVQEGVEKNFDLGLDEEEEPAQDEEAAFQEMVDSFEKEIPREYMEDPEGKEIFLLAKPAMTSLGVEEVDALLASLNQAAQSVIAQSRKPFVVEFGGPAVFMKAFNDGVNKDLGLISVLALLGAGGLLLLSTRRPLASLFILLPIVCAISCALAFAALTIGHLNIISSLLVAILLGLGVEFGIHMVLRTNEARVELPLREAILTAVPETMAGAFSGAVTNGAAFFVLIFASFSAYRQFGGIAAVGILMSWLFTYTLLPALIVLTERYLPGWVIRAGVEKPGRFLPPRWIMQGVLVLLPLVCAFGAWAMPRIQLERSFNALHGESVPDPVGHRSGVAVGSTLTPTFIWVQTLEEARQVEKIFDDLKREDPNPRGSIIETTLSLARAIPEDWDERKPELTRLGQLLRRLPDSLWEKEEQRLTQWEEATRAAPLRLEDLPRNLTQRFIPFDNDGTFLLYLPSRSVDDADELDDYVDKLETAVERASALGITTKVMSENRIAVHIFRQVFADAPFIAWAATLVALGMLLLIVRNVRETLVIFTPLAFGMLLMVAGMHLLGVKLNFINMCVIPSIFTVAIDNTVHVYHRYTKEGRAAMPAILANTGLAVLMASLVNASGYLPMLLADFYGMRSLGIVACLGMLGMVLATVAWFPALLLLLPEHWIRRGKMAEGEPSS